MGGAISNLGRLRYGRSPCQMGLKGFLAMEHGYYFRLSGLLAVAVEEGDVDAAAFIGVVKIDDVGFVEEIGIEDDRTVLAVRNRDGFGSALLEEFLNFVPVRVVIVFGKVPVVWRFFVPHDQAAIG